MDNNSIKTILDKLKLLNESATDIFLSEDYLELLSEYGSCDTEENKYKITLMLTEYTNLVSSVLEMGSILYSASDLCGSFCKNQINNKVKRFSLGEKAAIVCHSLARSYELMSKKSLAEDDYLRLSKLSYDELVQRLTNNIVSMTNTLYNNSIQLDADYIWNKDEITQPSVYALMGLEYIRNVEFRKNPRFSGVCFGIVDFLLRQGEEPQILSRDLVKVGLIEMLLIELMRDEGKMNTNMRVGESVVEKSNLPELFFAEYLTGIKKRLSEVSKTRNQTNTELNDDIEDQLDDSMNVDDLKATNPADSYN